MFAGLPESTLKPLQRLINAAARYVADLRPYEGVTNILKELHWLPIKQRIVTYKLCVVMNSAVSGVAPSYIKNMLTSVADMPGRGRLRSAASGSFDVPRVRTRIGSQALSCRWISSVEQSARGIENNNNNNNTQLVTRHEKCNSSTHSNIKHLLGPPHQIWIHRRAHNCWNKLVLSFFSPPPISIIPVFPQH